MNDLNNKHFTVCGILPIDGKILLVRHTYGTAKNRILLPGGYVHEGELPTAAAEREILEETGVVARAGAVVSLECRPERWCITFLMDYVSGEPHSDGYENSEILLLTAEEAVKRSDITNLSRTILTSYLSNPVALPHHPYIPASTTAEGYVLFQGAD